MNSIEPEFQNLLRGIQIRFARFLEVVLQGKKITVSQYNVLATLSQAGPVPMNQVAKKLHISKPAITHLVDRLEKNRWIRRQFPPHDRRVSLLDLTPQGQRLVQRVQKRFIEFGASVLFKVSPKERDVIKRFYEQLTEELDKVLSV
jgi:DNA-binding MarR family transcriptional regulator